MTGYREKKRAAKTRLRLAGLGLLLTSVGCMNQHSLAGVPDQESDFFLPNQFAYYNPLKHGAKHNAGHTSRSSQMDNAGLLRAAEQIRSTSMSSAQRALNHQWLMHAQDEDSIEVGGRVFSKLMRMGFKTYWEGARVRFDDSAKVIPDSQGDGRVTEDVDYKIRVSGNKIKLSFEYEF